MTINDIVNAIKNLIKPYSENPQEMTTGFSLDTDEYMGYEKDSIMYKIKSSVLGTKILNILGAGELAYDNSASGLTADNTQDAIDEIVAGLEVSRYGISYEEATGNVTRLFDAVGLTIGDPDGINPISSDFDNIYPWSEIRHVKVSDEGVIKEQFEHDYDTFDGEIMTYIPQFYYKDWREGGFRTCIISNSKLDGYQKMFQDKEYGLIASLPTSYDGIEYHSAIDEAPKTNVSYTNFINAFYAKGDGNWSMYDMVTFHALFLLTCIESGSTNHKGSYGRGINSGMPYGSSGYDIKTSTTNLNTVTVASGLAFYVGMVVQIGTSYTVNNIASDRKITNIVDNGDGTQTLTVDGVAFSTAIGNTCVTWGQSIPQAQYDTIGDGSGYILQWDSENRSHVCYRGVWDLWGNVYSFAGGFMRKDGEYYGSCDKTKYAITDPDGADGWSDLGLLIQNANGYQKIREAIKIDGGSIDVPIEWGSPASSETYYSAYLYYFTTAETGVRVLRLGGYWNLGSNVSLVFSFGSFSPSSDGVNAGARLIR